MSIDRRRMELRRAQGVSRRDMLAQCSTGFGLVALSGLLGGGKAFAAPPPNPFAPRVPHLPPKVKSVIFCFMSGGVSHVDTFDPKPRLKKDHGKPMPVPVRPTMFNQNGNIMASPWEFRNHGQSGLPVSELFPHIGACADDLAVIRSMTSIANEHAQGNYFIHTGFSLAGFPSAGAWTTYGLGSENQNLPGFVVLASGGAPLGGVNIYGNGFLPAVHQASFIDPTQKEALANITPREADPLQRKRLRFVEGLDHRHLARLQGDEQVESAIQNYEIAYRMQSAVPDLVDLRGESEATQRLYGMDSPVREKAEYARQCLLARRLAEAGVRFIEIASGVQWDHHNRLREQLATNCAATDQPIAALLTDLKARGMLKDTLVVWAGEFGRTPYAQAGDGRDHNHKGYSIWMVGGGVKGGLRYGATDEIGYKAVLNPMHIHDWHATMLHLLGLDHTKLTYNYGGRNFRLTNVSGEVAKGVLA